MKFGDLFPKIFEQLKPTMLPDEATGFHFFSQAGGTIEKKLASLHDKLSQTSFANVQRLVRELSDEAKLKPGIKVSTTGAVSLSVGGHRIDVPVEMRQGSNIFRMGGGTYTSARFAHQNKLLDANQAFVDTIVGTIQGKKGYRLPGVGAEPAIGVQEAAGEWMAGISTRMRQTMRSITLASGAKDISRAYFDRGRMAFPLASLPTAWKTKAGETVNLLERYEHLVELNKRISMGGFKQDLLTGKYMGEGMLDELANKQTRAFVSEVVRYGRTIAPQGVEPNIVGLKPGAVLPYLRESRGKGIETLYLNVLHPDEISMMAEQQKLQSGLYQEVKTMAFSKGMFGQGAFGRMAPVYVPYKYAARTEWLGGAMGVARSEQPTTLLASTIGMIHPGKSQYAHRFLERFMGDSGAWIGSGRASDAARLRWADKRIPVPAEYFKTTGKLGQLLTGMEVGETRAVGMKGREIAAALVEETSLLREAKPRMGLGAMVRRARAGQLAPVQRPVGMGLLGAVQIPGGVRGELIPIEPERLIESVTRTQSGMLQFQTKLPITAAGAVGLELPTAGLVGAGAQRFASLQKLVDPGALPEAVDYIMAMGDYGAKFGTKPAATTGAYLGHVFWNIERGIKGPRGRAAAEGLLRRLNLKPGEYAGGQFWAYASAREGGMDLDFFRRMYGKYLVPDAGVVTTGLEGELRTISKQAGLTPREAAKFQEAFKVPFAKFSDVVRARLPEVWAKEKAQILAAEAEGVTVPLFRGQAVGVRTVEETVKTGMSGMNLRLSELQTFKSQYAMLPTKDTLGEMVTRGLLTPGTPAYKRALESVKVREAYETVARGMLPPARESGVASDALRMFGMFMEGPPKTGELMPVGKIDLTKLTPEQFTERFAQIPELRGAKRYITPDDLLALGKSTLLTEEAPFAAGELKMRRGGFTVKLPEPIPLFVKKYPKAGGVEPLASKMVQELHVPGMEIYGKQTFDEAGRLYLSGASRLVGKTPEFRPFGEHIALLRELYEVGATGTKDVSGIRTRAQALIDALAERTYGADSYIKRYYKDTEAIKATRTRAVLPGAGPEDALTVGLDPKTFFSTRKGKEIWRKHFKLPLRDIERLADPEFVKEVSKRPEWTAAWKVRAERGVTDVGVGFTYPAVGRGHAQAMQFVPIMPHEVGLPRTAVTGRYMAFPAALGPHTSRDFDWDTAFAALSRSKEEEEALKVIYESQIKGYRQTQEMMERGQALFEGLGGKGPQARLLRQELPQFLEQIKTQGAPDTRYADYLEAILRQKQQTPLSHVTFRNQLELVNQIGTQYETVRNLGDTQLQKSIESIRNITGRAVDVAGTRATVGARAADWMGWMFGSGVYDVLKKEKAGGALEDFVASLSQITKASHVQPGAKQVERLQTSITRLFTGGNDLEDARRILDEVLQGGKGENVWGTLGIHQEHSVLQDLLAQRPGATRRPLTSAQFEEAFFKPLSEWYANVQYTTRKVARLPDSPFAKMAALFGETGVGNKMDRSADIASVMETLAKQAGVKTDPRWVHQADALFEQVQAQGSVSELNATMMRAVNEGTADARGIAPKTDHLATRGLKILDDIWSTKAGKIGIGVGAALLAYQMLKGVAGGDGDPPAPTYPGGGAPLPPRPLLDTAAQQMQNIPTQVPNPPVRVQRPDAMRTTATGRAVYSPQPPSMTMGYSSSLPLEGRPPNPEDDFPEASRWEVERYLAARMRSSF